jgi:hypothetical protein
MPTRLCDDPTREGMLDYLDTLTSPGMRDYNEFDIEEAIYWFAHDWHGGQGSNLYAALSASPFTPSPTASYIDADSATGYLYDELEARYTTPALPKIA